MTDPSLYDVTAALREATRYRATAGQDLVASHTVAIADKLATHMARHFLDPNDAQIAGRALMIVAASLPGVGDGIPLAVVCNVAGLAGHRLVIGPVDNDA